MICPNPKCSSPLTVIPYSLTEHGKAEVELGFIEYTPNLTDVHFFCPFCNFDLTKVILGEIDREEKKDEQNVSE